MTSKPRGLRQSLCTTILLGLVSVAALANDSPVLQSETAMPLCYCHCSYEHGARHCTKMCDLPQLLNRWWAISCHKRANVTNESSSPATTPGSRKTNRRERASL